MNVAIEHKKILLVGVAVLALAVAFLVVRPLLLGSDDSVTATPAPASSLPTAPAAKAPHAKAPAKPKIVLVPGLPAPVAKGLRAKPIVVVALSVTSSSPGASTLAAQAREGARTVGAGFVRVDLANETQARAMLGFAGADTNASLLVVRRPGTIVNRFAGYVDSAVVAQALVDAGARKPAAKPKKAAAKAQAAGKGRAAKAKKAPATGRAAAGAPGHA